MNYGLVFHFNDCVTPTHFRFFFLYLVVLKTQETVNFNSDVCTLFHMLPIWTLNTEKVNVKRELENKQWSMITSLHLSGSISLLRLLPSNWPGDNHLNKSTFNTVTYL